MSATDKNDDVAVPRARHVHKDSSCVPGLAGLRGHRREPRRAAACSYMHRGPAVRVIWTDLAGADTMARMVWCLMARSIALGLAGWPRVQDQRGLAGHLDRSARETDDACLVPTDRDGCGG